MTDIIVRLVAAWLAHPTHGVNALAAKLARANLTGPDDDAPPVVAIVNDADDVHAALNVMSVETVPALVVWADSHTDRPLKGYASAKDVIVGIGFITDDQVDAIAMNRACGYLLRAATISLARLKDGSGRYATQANRTLNNVELIDIASIEEQRITATQGSRKLWGILMPHVTAIDGWTTTMLGAPQL